MRCHKQKRLCSLVLALSVILCVTLISVLGANASETAKDGLLVEIVSEKESYSLNDEIKLDFKVTNTNEKDVKNVTLSAEMPDVLDTKDQKVANTEILKAGNTLELHVNASIIPASSDPTSATQPTQPSSSSNASPDSSTTSSGTNTGNTTTSGTNAAAVQTGQSTLLFAICLVVMLAALSAIWLFKMHKEIKNRNNIKKIISLVLCVSLLTGTLLATGLPVFAEETTVSKESITLSKEIEVGGTKLTVRAKVDYEKSEDTVDDTITKLSDDMYITNPQAEHVRYDEEVGIPYIDNEILITFKQGVDESAIETFIWSIGGIIIGKIAPTNTYQIQIPVCEEFADAEKFIAQVESSNLVDFASPNILIIENPAYKPNDTEWKNEWSNTFPQGGNWGAEAINAPEAWEYVDYMQNVNVGVIDNQFLPHNDLHFENIYYNMIDKKAKSYIHGTHVSGIIGAGFDNGIGVSGIAPKAKMYGFAYHTFNILEENNRFNTTLSRFTPENGWTDYDIIDSTSEKLRLTYLIEECHCRIINCSYGNTNRTFAANENDLNALNELKISAKALEPYLLCLIDKHSDFNIITGAGNESGDYYLKDSDTTKGFNGYRQAEKSEEGAAKKEKMQAKYGSLFNFIDNPKIRNRIIVVGAVERKTESSKETYSLCDFSNIGSRVDVVAPGKNIVSTVDNNGYKEDTGTSMAAPHVTGIAAMLYSLNPDIKADEVKRIICETADREVDGYKLVNAEAAVKAVMGIGTIGGKVVSAADGSALSDVKITAYQKLKSELFPIEFYTSGQGGFSKELISGDYEFDFEKDGYKPLKMEIRIDKDVITVLKDTIELQPKSAPVVNLVEDAMRGNYKISGTYQESGEFAIPKINLNSEDARNANKKILDDYKDYFRDNNGKGIYSLDYSYTVDKDTLSILITAKYIDNGYKTYNTFNFDIPSGKLLMGAELLSRYNYSESNAVISTQNDILRRYNEQGGNDEAVKQRYRQKALDQNKNISNMQFYLDNNKKVNIIYYAAWLAGAEGYYYNIPINKDNPIDIPSDNNQYTALELWSMNDSTIFDLLKDKNINIATIIESGTTYALVSGSELPGFYFAIQGSSNVTKDNYKNAPIAFIYMTEPAVFSTKQDSTYGSVAIGMSFNDLPTKFTQNMSKLSDGVYMVSLFNGASMARLQFNSNNNLQSMLITRHIY